MSATSLARVHAKSRSKTAVHAESSVPTHGNFDYEIDFDSQAWSCSQTDLLLSEMTAATVSAQASEPARKSPPFIIAWTCRHEGI